MKKKDRSVGKVSYTKGERVRLQDTKTKLWNTEGVVKKVITADDGTIVSYDIDIYGVITTRHRRYMCKIRNVDEEIAVTEEENRAGAGSESSQQ